MRLTPRSGGYVLPVKVVPGASRTRVAGAYGDGIKVTVAAVAERGAANEAVVDLLAGTLQVPRGNVQIVRGQTSQQKDVLILGLSAEEIERALSR